MVTMTISLPEEMMAFVETQAVQPRPATLIF